MREPDAMWGHVPVFIRDPGTSRPQGYAPAPWDQFYQDYVIPRKEPKRELRPVYDSNGVSIFYPIGIDLDPKYAEAIAWHKRQLREGVQNGIVAYPGGMRMVPATGFFISVRREAYGNRTIWSRVELREDLSGMAFGKKEILHFDPVACASSSFGIDSVESDHNSFPELFGNIVAYLPKAWPCWLKQRRLIRWKPVPEWLAALRARKAGNRKS